MKKTTVSTAAIFAVICATSIPAHALDVGGTLGGVVGGLGGGGSSAGGGLGAGTGANAGGASGSVGFQSSVGRSASTGATVSVSLDERKALRSINSRTAAVRGLTREQRAVLDKLDMEIDKIVDMLKSVDGRPDMAKVVAALDALSPRARAAVLRQCRAVSGNAGLFASGMTAVCNSAASAG